MAGEGLHAQSVRKLSLHVELVAEQGTGWFLGWPGWQEGGDRKGGCVTDSVLCAWCLITGANTTGGQYRVALAEHTHRRCNLPAISIVLMEATATC